MAMNFSFLHTVYILNSNFFLSRNVALMKFFSKKFRIKFPDFPNCERVMIKYLVIDWGRISLILKLVFGSYHGSCWVHAEENILLFPNYVFFHLPHMMWLYSANHLPLPSKMFNQWYFTIQHAESRMFQTYPT